jgi:hypothetical protein
MFAYTNEKSTYFLEIGVFNCPTESLYLLLILGHVLVLEVFVLLLFKGNWHFVFFAKPGLLLVVIFRFFEVN